MCVFEKQILHFVVVVVGSTVDNVNLYKNISIKILSNIICLETVPAERFVLDNQPYTYSLIKLFLLKNYIPLMLG